jgi:hypothetical protein
MNLQRKRMPLCTLSLCKLYLFFDKLFDPEEDAKLLLLLLFDLPSAAPPPTLLPVVVVFTEMSPLEGDGATMSYIGAIKCSTADSNKFC